MRTQPAAFPSPFLSLLLWPLASCWRATPAAAPAAAEPHLPPVPEQHVVKLKGGSGAARQRYLATDNGPVLLYGARLQQGGYGSFHRTMTANQQWRGLKQFHVQERDKAAPSKHAKIWPTERQAVRREAHNMQVLGMPVYRIYWVGEHKAFIETALYAGDLSHIVNTMAFQQMSSFEKVAALRYVWQTILPQLATIHRQGAIHGDLKIDNFLYHNDGHVQISDPGFFHNKTELAALQTAVESQQERLAFVVPSDFYAPEWLNPRFVPDAKFDIWALGCSCFEQLTMQAWPLAQHWNYTPASLASGLDTFFQARKQFNAGLQVQNDVWRNYFQAACRVDADATRLMLQKVFCRAPQKRLDAAGWQAALQNLPYRRFKPEFYTYGRQVFIAVASATSQAAHASSF